MVLTVTCMYCGDCFIREYLIRPVWFQVEIHNYMIIMKITLTKIFVCHVFGTIGTGYMSWHKIGEFIQVPQITVLQ